MAHHRLSQLASLWLSCILASQAQVYDISAAVGDQSSIATFTSGATDLDAPKVTPINSSAFDWWYFDVVPTDLTSLASIAVVFYTATTAAFKYVPPADTVAVVQITGSFENGTAFNVFVEGEGGATVTSDGNASSGSWNGTGLGWAHASGPTTYTVELNATQVGVEGTIEFNAVSDRSSSEVINEMTTKHIADRTGALSMRSCRGRAEHESGRRYRMGECGSRRPGRG
jgi:hypothetical protein